MGEHVVEELNQLNQLDPHVHWFCPRSTQEDYGLYFDDDVLAILPDESEAARAVRLQKVQEAESRRDKALEGCKIYAFNGADAKVYQNQFDQGLKAQLTRCDICVREYHRARSLLLQRLESQFDSEEVESFMETFDAMNTTRIGEGLDDMKQTLLDLPPDKRNIGAAGEVGMYALFEALNCVPFLRSEQALQQYFDQPFRLVQTNKKLKLPSYAPGMACFLYSSNQERLAWAFRNFGQMKRPLTSSEFEHGVKPFLESALSRVNVHALERGFLSSFWRGTKLIISKLSKDLVMNDLRAMDTNIYTIALEHFQIFDSHFQDLLSAYQALLELSPTDFWDALGTITAQTIFETIFMCPNMQCMLKVTEEQEPLLLDEKMEWTVSMVQSIKPANLLLPVRTMLDQLLTQSQKDEVSYSRHAQTVCWQKGLICLRIALQKMKQRNMNGPVVAQLIHIVAMDHIPDIMIELEGIEKKKEMQIEPTQQTCLDIVELTLALDIAGLTEDRRTINHTGSLDHELGVSSLNIWKLSMRQVKPGNPALANSILGGIKGLLALEWFPPRSREKAPRPTENWNNALRRIQLHVSNDLLERLDLFSPMQVEELMMEPEAAQGLIHLLFNGDAPIHQAALNVIKVISGADDRRDSLIHLVGTFRSITLRAVNQCLEKIARHRIFTPSAIALRLCADILSCLCDDQDGQLRRDTFSQEDLSLVLALWEKIWQLLGTIFEQTEQWSNQGRDKQMMQDFCRETMDLADSTFDQYSFIASKLQEVSREGDKTVRKMLLEFPKSRFMPIAKWLRLRDDYLIGKAVGLTCKILDRLRDVGIEIDNDAAQYIEDIVTSSEKHQKIRTKLSSQQKAELRRALEDHLQTSLSEVFEVDAFGKAKKQTNLQDWASSGRSSGASTPVGDVRRSKPGTIDVDAWSDAAKRKREIQAFEDEEMKKLTSSPASEAWRQRMEQQKQKKPVVGQATTKAAQKHKEEQNNFLLKRKKEKEEADKRRAAALAKEKGVVGAGSGVAGLGDMGKDHTMKGQNVMVSSDEDSDDDDDDEDDEGLDLFGDRIKKKIEKPNVDPNGAIGLKPEQKTGPTKIQRTARTSKDMRARLAPDLTSLHKTILAWDFFHDGDFPPGSKEHQFRAVANSFSDPSTYQDTFQPLLTLEAWQGMVKAREENALKPYEMKVQNRTNVDAFIEISSLIGHNENREIQLQEGDIILFSKAKNPANDSTVPHCLARVYKVKRQKAHLEIVYQVMPNANLVSSLAQQSVVYGLKVQSITPLEREYGALQALQYYDLCTQIVRAKPSKRMRFSEKQIAAYQDVWNVNPAQSEAINAALENEGFSLIQGPPGSGKTKTIIAIVGGLLTQALSSSSVGTKISMPKANGNQNTGADAPPKKLLVCAPSNAAVDELVMRLKEGVKTKGGRHHHLNIVRIGRSEAINAQVKDVTMEELVAKRLGPKDNDQKTREENAKVFKEHEKVSGELRELHARRESGQVAGKDLEDLENNIGSLRKVKNGLGIKIESVKDAERNAGRESELSRKRAQQAVLDEAHVICATLSGSGHDMFRSLNIDLETVIIDEAAQCVEMSSLIPLKYGCVKCVMVGDPKQLPPTVFSKEAAKFQYEQSLFVRMQNNFADEVHLLDTQYRMHPQISLFPSRAFYDGLLKDGQGMAGLRQKPWHSSELLAPYRFFDVAGQHQSAPKGHSLINLAEIEIAIMLYTRLTTDFPNYDLSSKVGIITPYKSQLKALKDRFSSRFGTDIVDVVEFNTTDAFQGRESEVIIFSCVRASPAGGIGFLQDIRRMNVGLTRAKSSLWVLGNSESLVRGQFWRKLVEDANARDCYSTGNLKAMLSKPSSAFPASKSVTASMLDASSHVSQMSGNKNRPNSSTSAFSGSQSTPAPTEYVSKAPPDTERMEGIRYRFEDRAPKKSAPMSDSGSARPTPDRTTDKASESADQDDVEMADADDTAGGSATPSHNVSRAETPLSGDETRLNQANGTVKPRPGVVAPSVPQPLRKRPAPSPFMPAKRTKPKPG